MKIWKPRHVWKLYASFWARLNVFDNCWVRFAVRQVNATKITCFSSLGALREHAGRRLLSLFIIAVPSHFLVNKLVKRRRASADQLYLVPRPSPFSTRTCSVRVNYA